MIAVFSIGKYRMNSVKAFDGKIIFCHPTLISLMVYRIKITPSILKSTFLRLRKTSKPNEALPNWVAENYIHSICQYTRCTWKNGHYRIDDVELPVNMKYISMIDIQLQFIHYSILFRHIGSASYDEVIRKFGDSSRKFNYQCLLSLWPITQNPTKLSKSEFIRLFLQSGIKYNIYHCSVPYGLMMI